MGSCCWRGYVARWEIVDGRLYLTQLRGKLPVGELSMWHLFPGFPDRVFAHWYTDELRLPHGALLKSVHLPFSSTYEREWVLEVERGVVTARRLQENVVPAEPAPPAPRRSRLAWRRRSA
jgi:hypothetical protein